MNFCTAPTLRRHWAQWAEQVTKRFAESVIERTVAMEASKIGRDACSTNGMKQMTRN